MGFPKDWKKIFTQIEENECDGGEYEYEYSFDYGSDDDENSVEEEGCDDEDEEDEAVATPTPVTKIKKIKYRIEKDMNPVAQEDEDCDDEKEDNESSINDKFPFAARKFILIGVKKSSVDKRDDEQVQKFKV
ncbi:unnamed protein product [[Candida] boidinii]|nr:unnamed protein product [[Candida] boidinii]